MIRKARDNVDAAKMLLGLGWRYPDAAANRLYYALYHAGWAFLRKCDREAPDHEGRRYFRHDEMEDYLDEEEFQSKLGLDPNWTEDWAELRNLRVMGQVSALPGHPAGQQFPVTPGSDTMLENGS
jgi:hypothetical protein